ncbi:MAG: hypothetical protein HPY55_06640 [Firmicutes bacterium]|nr:hypothetical protein [Bacillota bacterium]
MGRSANVRAVLTDHYMDACAERFGPARYRQQAAWIRNSLARRRPRRQKDGKYSLRLRGSSRVAILAFEGGWWIGITILKGQWDGERNERPTQEDMGYGA